MTPITGVCFVVLIACVVIQFGLWLFNRKTIADLEELLRKSRNESLDVYESNKLLRKNLDAQTQAHRQASRDLADMRVENTRLVNLVEQKQRRMESLERRLDPEADQRKPAADRPAAAVRAAAPAPLGHHYDAKSDSYVRNSVDDGSGLLQTAVLMSAFDSSPAREKEITDAQDSSHRSAGHEPVCSPSYESRHSGSSGESHSSHSSDSGSSGSSDSNSSGSCD